MTDDGAAPERARRPTRVRHVVLGLTVAAYMVTYMDRVLISAAVPSIQKEFGFSVITIGWVLGAYQWGYALFQIPGGWLGDRFGPRRALSGVVLWWSAFTAGTAMTWSAGSMIVCRLLFGVGEAGAFPIATRSLSRWMLPAERGFAQGLTHAGSRLGGALTPVIVVFLIARYGWRAPFLAFAVLGVIWSTVWFLYYRDTPAEHSAVNDSERALIAAGRSPVGKGAIPWRRILTSRQMWLLSAMYLCYGYDIGIFLTWFPKYLSAARGMSLARMGFYASLPLFAGVAGDILGGTSSDLLVRVTGRLGLARRLVAVAGFLLTAVTVPLAALSPDAGVSVLYFCAAVFGLELTVGVSWAVTLDIGGAFAGSVSAVMNTAGNVGAAISASITGYVVTLYGWIAGFWVIAGFAVLGALIFLAIDAGRPLADMVRSGEEVGAAAFGLRRHAGS